MADREKLIDILIDTFDNQYNQRGLITPQHTADHLIAKGVTIQKRGKWVVNRESKDDYEHHMCNKCKTNAPYHYTYIDDYDEGLDGEWFYLGQHESGIVEHMGHYCPNCGAKMDKADGNDIN